MAEDTYIVGVDFASFLKQMDELRNATPQAIWGGRLVFQVKPGGISWNYEPPEDIEIQGYRYRKSAT